MSSLQIGRRHIRNVISTIPALYCPLARLGKGRFRVVTRETGLVVEGFPRSGNSYVEAAFVCSQISAMKFAHHTHAAANVLRERGTAPLGTEPYSPFASDAVKALRKEKQGP